MQHSDSRNSGGLSPRREHTAKKLILANLSKNISIAELAQACALSRSHFSRAFKSSTGESPTDWIRKQRIEKAKKLIVGSDLSFAQISKECGFCDPAHFSRVFARSVGVSPITWRNRQCQRRAKTRLKR